MSGRPEGGNGEYGWGSPGGSAPDDFEPYRPSEASAGDATRRDVFAASDSQPARWWTEDVARPYRAGDSVRANKATGGDFVSHVPKHTHGEVVSTRAGLLGGEFAKVRFDNGYTEEVRVTDIDRERPWWT